MTARRPTKPTAPAGKDARLPLRLPAEQLERWKEMATARGMKLSEMVRAAVDAYGASTDDDLAELGREIVALVRKRFPAGKGK